jgi:hypothetical protein
MGDKQLELEWTKSLATAQARGEAQAALPSKRRLPEKA